jgi:hypothetical protein
MDDDLYGLIVAGLRLAISGKMDIGRYVWLRK